MIQYKKLMMTLALLLTAATGAWAQTTFGVKEITADMVPEDWSVSGSIVTPEDLANMGINFVGITEAQASTWADYPTKGHVYLLHAYTTSFQSVDWDNGNLNGRGTDYSRRDIYNLIVDLDYRVFVTTVPPIEVTPVAEPAANTKQWTFKQPGSHVVLTPIYARTAAFATEGTGSEMTLLLPAAAEGVIAGTDAPLIKEGTGVVALAGTSTTVKQGTLWYAIGTSATTAPAFDADAWSTNVPTAEDVDEDGADVPVWYYIKGADAPDGEDATLDNTFDNTEPVCLTVPVRSNKFDLTLNAANANTIEAGKATVSVDGTDKTSAIADGKLKAVKMGSEVKLNTKPGYKFRKVEVKKTQTSLTITDGGEFSTRLDIAGCTTWDQVITKNSDMIRKDNDGFIWPNFGHNTYTLKKGEEYINAIDEIYPDATDYKWVMAD